MYHEPRTQISRSPLGQLELNVGRAFFRTMLICTEIPIRTRMVMLPKLGCQPVVDNYDLHDNNSRVMCATSTIGLGTIEPTCAGSQRAPPSDVGAYLIPTTLSPLNLTSTAAPALGFTWDSARFSEYSKPHGLGSYSVSV